MSSQPASNNNNGPLLWSLIVAGVGALLLASNFFLLGDFDILNLWPLLLVFAGVLILVRGDLLPSSDFRTFGITRGSIESATLEINAAEIDVDINALENRAEERLIAGQYAYRSRPALDVDDVHAHLTMSRRDTPWLSFADWQMGVSPALPWQMVISTSLGHVSLDLQHIIMENALISTGIGDIHLTAPAEAFETLYVRSLLGNIHLTTPTGYRLRVSVEGGRFVSVQADETRYDEINDGVYISRDADDDLPMVDVVVRGTFGDVYLR